jgi:hypothetical protein
MQLMEDLIKPASTNRLLTIEIIYFYTIQSIHCNLQFSGH